VPPHASALQRELELIKRNPKRLLLLVHVLIEPQWIRQPKPRDVVYDECVCVPEGASAPGYPVYALSNTPAFSLRLMLSRLAPGTAPASPGPSASPPLSRTSTQRAQTPYLPSAPGLPLCTSNVKT
jgi:hypothetical protein